MPDLTLKRLDAATDKIVEKVFESCLDPENSVDYGKALRIAAEDGFLAGMNLAAEVEPVMDYNPSDPVCNMGQREGRDRTRAAIKKRARWLRKEMKANG